MWNGATVELEGISDVEYVADETPMVSYVNVHAILDARRSRAKVAASNDVGNSQGSITIPGCIAATPIEMPIDAVEGIPLEMPLVYFYGHITPRVNPSELS
ncbi:uncharacterized protein A4U43_C03F4100 [Asparagus officinalis]|uniref:Uncharacterized protein n=1 Tax=Asparagus officinalis TaxID=4686 RepID=A0A5P1F9Y3_ASPOF|nr:uncharacterized protein A4U43_C03F4100 [Asparagus officinalis]